MGYSDQIATLSKMHRYGFRFLAALHIVPQNDITTCSHRPQPASSASLQALPPSTHVGLHERIQLLVEITFISWSASPTSRTTRTATTPVPASQMRLSAVQSGGTHPLPRGAPRGAPLEGAPLDPPLIREASEPPVPPLIRLSRSFEAACGGGRARMGGSSRIEIVWPAQISFLFGAELDEADLWSLPRRIC